MEKDNKNYNDAATEEVVKESENEETAASHVANENEILYKYYVSYLYMRDDKSGPTFSTIVICATAITSREDIKMVRDALEKDIEHAIPDSLLILGFSNMGTTTQETYMTEAEGIDDQAKLKIDAPLSKEYVESNEEDIEDINTVDGKSIMIFEIRYQTSTDGYSELYVINIPTFIDITKENEDTIKDVIRSFENISTDVDIRIISIKAVGEGSAAMTDIVTPE